MEGWKQVDVIKPPKNEFCFFLIAWDDKVVVDVGFVSNQGIYYTAKYGPQMLYRTPIVAWKRMKGPKLSSRVEEWARGIKMKLSGMRR